MKSTLTNTHHSGDIIHTQSLDMEVFSLLWVMYPFLIILQFLYNIFDIVELIKVFIETDVHVLPQIIFTEEVGYWENKSGIMESWKIERTHNFAVFYEIFKLRIKKAFSIKYSISIKSSVSVWKPLSLDLRLKEIIFASSKSDVQVP